MFSRVADGRLSLTPVLSLLLIVPLLAACSRRPAEPPPPAPTVVDISGTSAMNAGGNAAIVRVYMLASDAAFRRTPIQDFWQDDSAALGTDLAGSKREILLYPGDQESFTITPGENVAFVGIAADLREPDPNGWRVIRPVDELRGRRMNVVVTEDRLDVTLGSD